jgi:hypothetical protein
VRLSVSENPVSLAVARSGEGAEGTDVSTVMLVGAEAGLTFPAVSVAVAVRICPPSASELEGVKLQLPDPSAVVVPREVVPSNTSTTLLAVATPVKVGVLSLVILSMLDAPVSVAAVMSGAEGAPDGLVLIVMLRAAEAGLTFPAPSLALAVMVCPPSDRGLEGVKLQFPDPSAVTVPKAVDPSNT